MHARRTHTRTQDAICVSSQANCLMCVSLSVWELVIGGSHFLSFGARLSLSCFPKTFVLHTLCVFVSFVFLSFVLSRCLFSLTPIPGHWLQLAPLFPLHLTLPGTCSQTATIAVRLFQEVFPAWRVSCCVFCRQVPHHHRLSLTVNGALGHVMQISICFDFSSLNRKSGQLHKMRRLTPLNSHVLKPRHGVLLQIKRSTLFKMSLTLSIPCDSLTLIPLNLPLKWKWIQINAATPLHCSDVWRYFLYLGWISVT